MSDVNKYIQAIDGDDPKPKKKTGSPSTKDFIDSVDGSSSSDPLLGGKARTENPDNYDFNLKPNFDNDLYRAERQGFGEELGKSVVNLIPNIITGIGEQVGYLGALATEWGDDRDYSNALTETMKKWHNPAGEVYQKPTKDTFALGDSAWWVNHGFGLVESVGEFAALGYGVGSLFSKGAALLSRAGAYARTGAQVATAATLAYSEGAMSGHNVFKRTYDTNYMRGLADGLAPTEADEKAKHLAAQAAATTVQLNTMLGTALNISSVGMLFKHIDDVDQYFMKGAGKRAAGETTEAFETRIANLTAADPGVANMIGGQGKRALAREAVQEGGEEMMNQFTERAGTRVGESGKAKGFIEQFNELENFFSDTMNEEGALNFILGAFGGVAQTVVLNHTPSQKQTELDDAGNPIALSRDEEGNATYKTKLYSGSHVAKNQRLQYFNNAKEAVLSDLNWIKEKNAEIQTHLASGDKDKARAAVNELMGAHHLKAVMTGTTDNWIQEYEGYGSLDNTKDLGEGAIEAVEELREQQKSLLTWEKVEAVEDLSPGAQEQYTELQAQIEEGAVRAQELSGKTEAMLKGFADDTSDNDYKAKAAQTVSDLKLYDGWHKELQKQFRTNPEFVDHNIPSMILSRKIDDHLRNRFISSLEQELAVQKLSVDEAIQGITSVHFNATVNDYNRRVVSSHNAARKLQDKIAALEGFIAQHNSELIDPKDMQELLSEFRIDYDPDKLDSAVKKLHNKLIAQRDKRMQDAETTEKMIADSLQFMDWQEKQTGKKSLRDYLEFVAKQVPANEEIVDKEIGLDNIRNQHQIAGDELRDILQNPVKFARKVYNDVSNMKKSVEADIQEENVERERTEKEITDAAMLREKVRDYTLSSYKKQLVQYQQILLGLQAQVPTASSKTDKLKNRLSREQSKLREKIADAKLQIADLTYEIERLSSREVDIAPTAPIIVSIPDDLVQALQNFVNVLPKGSVPTIKELNAQLNVLLEAEEIEPSTLDQAQRRDLIRDMIAIRKTEVNSTEDTELEKATAVIAEVISRISSPLTKTLVQSQVDSMLNNPENFQWGFFDRMFVAKGTLSAADAATILSNVAKIVNIVPESDEVLETTDVVEDISAPLTPKPDEPDVFVVTPNKKTDEAESGPLSFVGKRAMSVNKIQRLDLEYKEFITPDKAIRKVSTTSKLNKNTNLNVLSPKFLEPGSQIRFEVDTKYNGNLNIDTELSADEDDIRSARSIKFEEYTDETGKVANSYTTIAEVPIKIIEVKSGEVVGYLPRLGWVKAKYPNTDNYRNVITPDDFGEDEETPLGVKSIDEHEQDLMSIRNKVVKHYNAGSLPVVTTVGEKSAGALIKNVVLSDKGKSEVKSEVASVLLPDTDLQIAVIMDNEARIEPSKSFHGSLTANEEQLGKLKGTPHALAPMANGQYSLIPLANRLIEEFEVDTMLHAIQTYLSGDEVALTDYKKLTGFDLQDAKELRSFLNQHYTFTQSFKLTDLVLTLDPVVSKFLFNVTDKAGKYVKGEISVGTSYSGQDKVVARLQDGKLNDEFVEEFRKGMKGRFKNIIYTNVPDKLAGLNSSTQVVEVVAINGKLAVRKKHKNYNEYVKSFSTTSYSGQNQAEDGTYIYGVHPNISVSLQGINDSMPGISAALEDIPSEFDKEKEKTSLIEATQEDFDLVDGFSFDNKLFTAREDNNSKAITLKLLSDIHTFETPEARRNAKTPEEAFDELQKAGIQKLPEGFNPFLKCD